MSRQVLIARFATEEDVLGAVRAAREHGFRIADVYTPYAVHGLDQALGLRHSRLPIVCFAFGLLGAGLKLAFQFWTMAVDWPQNVGGKPWNSLPAYVPITFEVMVLMAGLAVVLAFMIRCRLFLGKQAAPSFADATDDRFVLVLEGVETALDANVARRLFEEFHAVQVEEVSGEW
jgi:hypothetical protein